MNFPLFPMGVGVSSTNYNFCERNDRLQEGKSRLGWESESSCLKMFFLCMRSSVIQVLQYITDIDFFLISTYNHYQLL